MDWPIGLVLISRPLLVINLVHSIWEEYMRQTPRNKIRSPILSAPWNIVFSFDSLRHRVVTHLNSSSQTLSIPSFYSHRPNCFCNFSPHHSNTNAPPAHPLIKDENVLFLYYLGFDYSNKVHHSIGSPVLTTSFPDLATAHNKMCNYIYVSTTYA